MNCALCIVIFYKGEFCLMGKWNDWLSGGGKNWNPSRGNEPEYYEDTHSKDGIYTGTAEQAKSLPDKNQAVVPKQYQNVVVYDPKSPEDVQRLIDYLKRREPAIINLDDTDADVAQRILDFTAGAVYALNGSIHRISTNIFLLSPEGVEITVPYDIK